MRNLISYFLSLYFATSLSIMAGPQPKSPETNGKDQGVMKDYHKELKKQGWHRKEASRVTDELVHTFGDEILQPLPNLNEHINRMVTNYQIRYDNFVTSFVGAKKNSKRRRKPSSKPGEWTHIVMNPTAGRIYDLELNPNKPNELYANPDADGIFFTRDRGRNWDSITDNIPSRLDRDSSENIIVDPANFYHVFSSSHLGNLYETKDRGKSWARIKNSKRSGGKSPQFK